MNKTITPPKPKKFSLSNEEFSQLAFFEEHRKAKELEYVYWVNEVNKIKENVLKRLVIDPTKVQVDWSQVWHNGELSVYENISSSPILKVDPKLQEAINQEVDTQDKSIREVLVKGTTEKGEKNGSPELSAKPE